MGRVIARIFWAVAPLLVALLAAYAFGGNAEGLLGEELFSWFTGVLILVAMPSFSFVPWHES